MLPTILLLLRVFADMGTFTKLLPSKERSDTHTDTDWWEGFMKYAIKMGSDAMIYTHT
jgi:hypothetical protein